MSAAPRALAVSTTGSVFFIDGTRLRVVSPDATQSETVEIEQPLDVASCGAEMAVLARGEVNTISVKTDPGGDALLRIERVGATPTGVHRIACVAEGRLEIVYGAELWSSLDGGRSWTARDNLPAVTINGVAATGTAIWIATPVGLLRLPWSQPPSPPAGIACGPGELCPGVGSQVSSQVTSDVRSEAASYDRGLVDVARPSAGGRRWRWWYGTLPRIDLSFAAGHTGLRRDLLGLVVLTFGLSGPSERALRIGRVSTDAARRRLAAHTWRSILTEASSNGTSGDSLASIGAEERRALIQVLEEQP
jgi:hypothetical protein